jgi:hypothetical protein
LKSHNTLCIVVDVAAHKRQREVLMLATTRRDLLAGTGALSMAAAFGALSTGKAL